MINVNNAKKKKFCIILFLIGITIFVFYPTVLNGFLDYWDDQWVVMNHYTESGLKLLNLYHVLMDFYNGQYAPLNELFYLTVFSIVGYQAFYYHVACLFLHILNVILIYYFILNLSSSSFKLCGYNNRIIAFISALLFSIHPFNVESVAWISASKVLIYAFFYLVTMLLFIRFLQTQRRIYYLLSYISFFASFLGKEQAVTLPISLLLVSYFLDVNLSKSEVLGWLFPFFMVALFMGITTMLSQQVNEEGILSDNVTYSFVQRIVFGCYAYVEYFFKIILPINLLYIYPFPIQAGDTLPVWLWIYPVALCVIIYSFWRYIRQYPIFGGITFFTINLLPVLHIIPMSRYAIVADRYAYLSVIGICFIMAYYIVHWYNFFYGKWKKILFIFFFLYLVGLGTYTHARISVWMDTNSLKKEIRELLLKRKNYNSEINHMFYNH